MSNNKNSSSHLHHHQQQQQQGSCNIPYYRPYTKIKQFLSTYLHLSNTNESNINNISVGLWSGDVYISNVSIQTNAWNELLFAGNNSKYSVKIGKIGSISISVPWVQFCKGVKGIIRLDMNDVEIIVGYNSSSSSIPLKDDIRHDNNTDDGNIQSLLQKEEEFQHQQQSNTTSSISMLGRIMKYIASSFVWWVLVGLSIQIQNVHVTLEQQDDENGMKVGIDIPNICIDDSCNDTTATETAKEGGMEEEELILNEDYLKKQVSVSNIGLFLQQQDNENKKEYLIENVSIQVPNLRVFRSPPEEIMSNKNNISTTTTRMNTNPSSIALPPQISADIEINSVYIKLLQHHYQYLFNLLSLLNNIHPSDHHHQHQHEVIIPNNTKPLPQQQQHELNESYNNNKSTSATTYQISCSITNSINLQLSTFTTKQNNILTIKVNKPSINIKSSSNDHEKQTISNIDSIQVIGIYDDIIIDTRSKEWLTIQIKQSPKEMECICVNVERIYFYLDIFSIQALYSFMELSHQQQERNKKRSNRYSSLLTKNKTSSTAPKSTTKNVKNNVSLDITCKDIEIFIPLLRLQQSSTSGNNQKNSSLEKDKLRITCKQIMYSTEILLQDNNNTTAMIQNKDQLYHNFSIQGITCDYIEHSNDNCSMLESSWNVYYYHVYTSTTTTLDGSIIKIATSRLNVVTSPAQLSSLIQGMNVISCTLNCLNDEKKKQHPLPTNKHHDTTIELNLESIIVSLLLPPPQTNERTASFSETKPKPSSIEIATNAEIILEESIADYLSYLSCFSPDIQEETILISGRTLCFNRLLALGISSEIIDCCIDLARCAFVEDVKMIQLTNEELLFDMNNGATSGVSASSTTNEIDNTNHTKRYNSNDNNCKSSGSISSLDHHSETTTTDNHAAEEHHFHIIEISIKNAVEKALSYVLDSISFLENVRSQLVLQLDSISFTFIPNNSNMIKVDILHGSLRNGSGIFLWKCGSCINNNNHTNHKPALVCTIMEEKRDHNNKSIDLTMECMDVVFVSKDVIHVISSLNPIITSLLHQSSPSSNSASTTSTTTATNNTKSSQQMKLNIQISIQQGNISFTSDELIPFTRILLHELVIQNNDHLFSATATDVWKISCTTFQVWDDTPVGHTYPDTIIPLQDDYNYYKNISVNKKQQNKCLIIDIITPHDYWTYPTQVHLNVSKVRIILLKRFLHEMSQFFDNEHYGIGKLFNECFHSNDQQQEEEVDENGNPPPPLLWSCTITDSLIILPRDSKNMDIVGLQTEIMEFGNRFVDETWELDLSTTNNTSIESFHEYYSRYYPPKVVAEEPEQPQPKIICSSFLHQQQQQQRNSLSYNSSVTSEEFFDCIEDFLDDDDDHYYTDNDCNDNNNTDFHYYASSNKNTPKSNNNSPIPNNNIKQKKKKQQAYKSSHDKSMIRRISFQTTNIRIFTSLGDTLQAGTRISDNDDVQSYLLISNRAFSNQLVYQAKGVQESWCESTKRFFVELCRRRWIEVTVLPMTLSVLADYNPNMRLFIHTCGGTHCCNSTSQNVGLFPNTTSTTTSNNAAISWNVSMAQFYLILSVWYGNMQELPLLFPFEEEFIRKNALFHKPNDILKDWPSYGTPKWVERIKNIQKDMIASEIALHICELYFKCSFDSVKYFGTQYPPTTVFTTKELLKFDAIGVHNDAFCLSLRNVYGHIVHDIDGLMRLSFNSDFMEILDSRCINKPLIFNSLCVGKNNIRCPCTTISAATTTTTTTTNPIDLTFGLDFGRYVLLDPYNTTMLENPISVSVFLGPDNYCLINIATQEMDGVLPDLSLIWMVLDYFGMYFRHDVFGYPVFVAEKMKNHWIKQSFSSNTTGGGCGNSSSTSTSSTDDNNEEDDDNIMNLDVRTWFLHPLLILPSSNADLYSSCLALQSNSGLFYRFKSIQNTFSSQEVCARNISLDLAKQFLYPSTIHGYEQGNISTSTTAGRSHEDIHPIADHLTFSLLYDFNVDTNQYNLSFRTQMSDQVLYDENSLYGIELPDMRVNPKVLPKSTALRPVQRPTRRNLGGNICNVQVHFETMSMAHHLLATFLGVNSSSITDEAVEEDYCTFSITSRLEGICFLFCDPVLKNHLPIAIISVPSLILNVFQPTKTELFVILSLHVFVDYFNIMRKSWEPLIDQPLKCLVMYETSSERGKGLTLTCDTICNVNLTSALVELVDEVKESCIASFQTSFSTKHDSLRMDASRQNIYAPTNIMEQSIDLNQVHISAISQIRSTARNEKVPFSIYNFTGNSISVYQKPLSDVDFPSSRTAADITISLKNNDRAKLTFPATISVIRNTHVVEIPLSSYFHYKSKRESNDADWQSTNLAVDVHIPGFKTINGIRLDHLGKKFRTLYPTSPLVRGKMKDWRLENALKLVTSTSSVHGGRQITIKSTFEIINKTSQSLILALHPDPRYIPHSAAKDVLSTSGHSHTRKKGKSKLSGDSVSGVSLFDHRSHVSNSTGKEWNEVPILEPNETYQIPINLLENALHLEGKQLGSIWLAPQMDQNACRALRLTSSDLSESNIGYTNVPIQLAKILHQTSAMFDKAQGDPCNVNLNSTGMQIACPIITENGTSVPYCFVVSIYRSPVVGPIVDTAKTPSGNKPNLNASYEFDSDDDVHSNEINSEFREGMTLGTSIQTSKQQQKLQIMKQGATRLLCQSESIRTPLQEDLDSTISSKQKVKSKKSVRNIHVNPLKHSIKYGKVLKQKKADSEDLLEVSRSRAIIQSIKSPLIPGSKQPKAKKITHEVHSPVAYRLSIHAPFIIENLLSVSGKYELMHATRRQVVWSGHLNSGESMHIHSIGLDAPLYLLLNLGFARTPNGGGALIHDGNLGRSRKKGTTSNNDKPCKQRDEFNQKKYKLKKEATNVISKGLDLVDQFVSLDGGNTHVIASETEVVDSLGQHLLLHIDNILGGGGQRRVVVYCPYWILNFTEHTLRYRQENSSQYVSGTVSSPEKDGSTFVDNRHRNNACPSALESNLDRDSKTIFAGTKGALHSAGADEPRVLSQDQQELLLNNNLDLDTLAAYAFMFNFQDAYSISHKLCVQLYDIEKCHKFVSDESSGIHLDTVGVTQIAGMHCKDGRMLEVSVYIGIAPGRLSPYTKLVRFSPRYILVNQLERPIRLWQDNSILHSNFSAADGPSLTENSQKSSVKWHTIANNSGYICMSCKRYGCLFHGRSILNEATYDTRANHSAIFIASSSPNEYVAFHLPDSRSDRQIRIDFGAHYNLTASFPVDVSGEYALRVSPATDASNLTYVSSRASPQYKIIIPPIENDLDDWDGELGIWFETSWDQKAILVKRVKKGKFSFNNTDIRVGDQLLYVDNVPVSRMTFNDTMKLLKERMATVLVEEEANDTRSFLPTSMSLKHLTRSTTIRKRTALSSGSKYDVQPPQSRLVLTFRTLEECKRIVRFKAFEGYKNLGRSDNIDASFSTDNTAFAEAKEIHVAKVDLVMNVEVKLVNHSLFLYVRPFDTKNPPYKIDNRTRHFLNYRQRGCDGHPWTSIAPREKSIYFWEEPMQQRKLSVRVAAKKTKQKKEDNDAFFSVAPNKNTLRFIHSEYQGHYGPCKTIKLEIVGFRDWLPCPVTKTGGKVSSNGAVESENSLHCQVDTEGVARVLVITEQNSSDSNLLQEHLQSLSELLREEENRSYQFQTILQCIQADMLIDDKNNEKAINDSPSTNNLNKSEAKDKTRLAFHESPSSPQRPHNFDSEESSQELFDQKEYSDFVEKQIKNIASDYPEDCSITECNQLFVQVVEAAGLKVSGLSGLANPYCEISFKNMVKTKDCLNKQRRLTYFVEKSIYPKWSNQSFIFKVPPKNYITRGQFLRVRIWNNTKIMPDSLLGQTDIPLRSLVNQKELNGWYPLRGRGSSTSIDHAHGSLKLRVQWIYSIPALLEYFIMTSDRELEALRKRKFDIESQIDSLKFSKKKEMSDISLFRSINRRNNSRNQLGGNNEKAKKMRMKSTINGENIILGDRWNLRDVGRSVRNSIIVSLDIQTAEIRKRRKQNFEVTTLTNSVESPPHRRGASDVEDFVNNSQVLGPIGKKMLEKSSCRKRYVDYLDQSLISSNKHSSRSIFSLRSSGDPEDIAPLMSLSLNLPSSGGSEGIASLMPLSFLDITEESITEIESRVGEDDPRQLLQVDFLYDQGLLYHKSSAYCHTMLGMTSFLFASNNLEDDLMDSNSQTRFFLKTWTEAQAFFNDNQINSVYSGSLSPSKVTLGKNEAFNRKHESPITNKSRNMKNLCFTEMLLCLPKKSPIILKDRYRLYAEEINASISSFTKVAKRSIKSVSLPGGWFTIRPITALNLSGTSNKLYVKLSFGAISLTTKAVDNTVCPTWGRVDTTLGDNKCGKRTTRNTTGSSILRADYQGFDENSVDNGFSKNDLELFIDAFGTNGFLRLAVMEERIKSDVEVGVVLIPIETSLSCCYESEKKDSTYCAWFPLSPPQDCVNQEGDMGLSKKPEEAENESDHLFNNPYQPCIKLLFFWRPEVIESFPHSDDTQNTDKFLTRTRETLTTNSWNYLYGSVGIFSVVLIDSESPRELLSVYLTDLDVRYSVSNSRTRLGLTIGDLQLDNQLDNALEPVIVFPTPSINPLPTMQLFVVKNNVRSKNNVYSFEHAEVILQELDVKVEDIWLLNIWRCFTEMRRSHQTKILPSEDGATYSSFRDSDDKSKKNDGPDFAGDSSFNHSFQSQSAASTCETQRTFKKLYIEHLILGSIRLNLSYYNTASGSKRKSADQSDVLAPINTASSDLFLRWSENSCDDWNYDKDGYTRDLNVVSAIFPSITDFPIRHQKKLLPHVFEDMDEILQSLQRFYVAETLRQIYKIIGSLDFVGNPNIAMKDLLTGVRDFFVEPSVAFLKSPSMLGVGVARGTLSLLSNSTSGVFGLAARISGGAARGLSTLSMDSKFQMQHAQAAQAHKSKDQHSTRKKVTRLVVRPVKDITFGVMGAVIGLFVEPVKRAKKDGPIGLVKGLGIGTVGVVAKPLVGVFDAFAHFTEGIQDIAKSVNMLEKRLDLRKKRRFPYVFSMGSTMTPYNEVGAFCVHNLLKAHAIDLKGKADSSKRMPIGGEYNEHIVHSEALFMAPGCKIYIIVTTKRVVLFDVRQEGPSGNKITLLDWQISYNEHSIVRSRLENKGHHGIALCVSQYALSHTDKLTDIMSDHIVDHVQFNTLGNLSVSEMHLSHLDLPRKEPLRCLCQKIFVGDFYHRPQLARIHNAICCLMGDFRSISFESGLSQNGSADEGYFVFGSLFFQPDVSISRESNYLRRVSDDNDEVDGDISSRSISITPKKPDVVTCFKHDTSFLESDQTSDLASSNERKEAGINQRLEKVEVLLEKVLQNQNSNS